MDDNSRVKTKKRKKHGLLSAVAAIAVLFIGLSLLLYPSIADYMNSLAFRRDIEEYEREISRFDDSEREAQLAAAREYNARLLKRTDRIAALDIDGRAEYNTVLDPFGSGMMGYIEIASLNIYLPIFHGTDESVLRSGVGHIEGSSLPVGGDGVHAVLSGHTGLPSAKLFSSIDRLSVGDTFVLHILGETLVYRIASKVTVLPEEVGELRILPDSDICTLMTCTPYGINTHRLLLRGERVTDPGDDPGGKGEADSGYAGDGDPAGAGADIPGADFPVLPAAAAVVIVTAVTAAVILLKRKKK